jgi:uncharacterized membrane protein
VAEKQMTTARMEAFSDGVIAIIVTIMVLELKVPEDMHPARLVAMWPIFLSYALSYLMVAEYWINHHHLLQHAQRIDSRVLWANMLFLFCLSFIPFATGYLGQSRGGSFAVVVYSAVSLVCGISFLVLGKVIAAPSEEDGRLDALHRGSQRKGLLAITVYLGAVIVAFRSPAVALVMDLAVAIIYFMPNMWIESPRRGTQ